MDIEKTTNKYFGVICVIISATIFGLMPLGAKYLYSNGSNSVTLTFHRVLFSSPILYILARRKSKDSMKITWQQLKEIFILSLAYVSTPLLLLASYNYISTGTATTVHFIYPVLVLVACALFFGEKITLIRGLSTVLCMVGLAFFYTPGDSLAATGLIISFLSGVTYAFYIVYIAKSKLKGLDVYVIAFYLTILGSIEVFIISLLTNTLTFSLTKGAWLGTLIFAVATSGIATVLFQIGTRIIGPQRSSLLSTFEPLTSVIVGVLVFNEKMTILSAIGIVLVLMSVILLGIYDR